jgi:hypothetical protein
MALKYYQAENYGVGFITHEDSERSSISGYPGNIWVTENVQWAERVGAVEKTKQEAQAIVDTAVSASYTPPESTTPPQVILP